jgi:hypothetical protein
MHDPKNGNRQPSNTKHGLFYCLTVKTYNYIDIPMVYKKLNMFLIYLTLRVSFLFPFNFIAKIGKYFPYLYFTWLHIVLQFILLEWKVIIFEEGN